MSALRNTLVLLFLTTAALLPGCLAEPELKLPDEHLPLDRPDGWAVATPEQVGIDRGGLDRAYASFFSQDRFKTAIALLVLRDGRLIGEGYARDRADADRIQNIKSCTKSVTAILTGMALDRGLLPSFDTRLGRFLPGVFDSPVKDSITLEQALTMRTGLAYENDRDNDGLLIDLPASSLQWMQKGDLAWAPGTRFHYSDAPPHLVGAMLQRLAGHTLEECARPNLFDPLGITDVQWDVHPDGFSYGAFGLYLKPRDLAKLGLLVLQEGRWGDRQVVPADWVRRMTSTQAQTPSGPYGYYWWIRPAFNAFTMAGHGGTYCYVIPDKRMVVVMTAWPYVDIDKGIDMDEFEDLVQILVDAAN